MVGRDRRSLPFSNNFCVFLLILYCTFHRRNTNVIVRFIHSISCEIIVSRTKCTCLSALVKTFSQNAKHNNTCHRRNENSITSCFHTKERLSRFFQKAIYGTDLRQKQRMNTVYMVFKPAGLPRAQRRDFFMITFPAWEGEIHRFDSFFTLPVPSADLRTKKSSAAASSSKSMVP